eukprot:COSAG02_NODE_2386_length_8989_cov_6.465917_3_plen_72_part_00
MAKEERAHSVVVEDRLPGSQLPHEYMDLDTLPAELSWKDMNGTNYAGSAAVFASIARRHCLCPLPAVGPTK